MPSKLTLSCILTIVLENPTCDPASTWHSSDSQNQLSQKHCHQSGWSTSRFYLQEDMSDNHVMFVCWSHLIWSALSLLVFQEIVFFLLFLTPPPFQGWKWMHYYLHQTPPSRGFIGGSTDNLVLGGYWYTLYDHIVIFLQLCNPPGDPITKIFHLGEVAVQMVVGYHTSHSLPFLLYKTTHNPSIEASMWRVKGRQGSYKDRICTNIKDSLSHSNTSWH